MVVIMSSKLLSPGEVVDVWNDNLEEEFLMIEAIIDDFPYVSMDGEFPGIVIRSFASDTRCCDQNYDLLKSNVNLLKPIQFGLTLTDAIGNFPDLGDGDGSWQFNFSGFDLAGDPHAYETIMDLNQRGIDFQKNQEHGIDPAKFAEILMSSGLVCNPDVTWVTFHSAFDFGFLVKMLTGQDLPDDLTKFKELLKAFFGINVYDVKHLMSHCQGLYGGLHQVARLLELEVDPVDVDCHQAGAHSFLTWKIFEKITDLFCGGPRNFAGVIYGLEQY